MKTSTLAAVLAFASFALAGAPPGTAGEPKTIDAELTFAPNVPPPVTRKEPAVVRVHLEAGEQRGVLMEGDPKPVEYVFWNFNGRVPGPFLRLRVGDTLEMHLKNPSKSTMIHNIDLHAVSGPGGGAAITMTPPGGTTVTRFKMLNPGLFFYHCAAPPVWMHIANGMYGLILVEPEEGLSPVDHEYYVLQSEFYTKGKFGKEGLQSYDPDKALAEHPEYVVFNGKVGSLMDQGALQAKTGETIRIFFGNGGPNLVSSFHVIGVIFDKVFREGSLLDPTRNIQTTLVPAGSASTVEFKVQVPGNYTLVDHSIFRLSRGAMGLLQVSGDDRPDLYGVVPPKAP